MKQQVRIDIHQNDLESIDSAAAMERVSREDLIIIGAIRSAREIRSRNDAMREQLAARTAKETRSGT